MALLGSGSGLGSGVWIEGCKVQGVECRAKGVERRVEVIAQHVSRLNSEKLAKLVKSWNPGRTLHPVRCRGCHGAQ